MQNKPNLFIVGAPKAGTSFLWVLLKNHKDIFFSKNPEKELNFFSYEELKSDSYYKDFKINNLKRYLNCFKNANNTKYIVDGSVSYFAYPNVPKKIYKFNQDAKIVIIIRNPIKRAVSHYEMDVRMSYADKPLINYILDENSFPAHYHQYIKNSMYACNIKRYINTFGKKNVFIMNLDCIKDEVTKLYKFLDIDELNVVSTANKVNKNKMPSNIVSRFLQHNRYIATILKRIIPKKLVTSLERFMYKEAVPIKVSNTELNRLDSIFKADILELQRITNIKLMS
ncbi:sulfotransferase domain-containing protein [Flavobacteriales bacterium]|nr:sulfotransferase domain-containing protein [Flavobacteriales bacterium]